MVLEKKVPMETEISRSVGGTNTESSAEWLRRAATLQGLQQQAMDGLQCMAWLGCHEGTKHHSVTIKWPN